MQKKIFINLTIRINFSKDTKESEVKGHSGSENVTIKLGEDIHAIENQPRLCIQNKLETLTNQLEKHTHTHTYTQNQQKHR